MITHDLIQNSWEWHQHRRLHDNASDAPAMMGKSKYKTRDQLLAEKKNGFAPEADAALQARFDDGHRYEALARPRAEALLGRDLYPVTATLGNLSASFDGLTADDSIAFEHKSLNDEIRNAETVDDLHPQYHIQMEQQLLISGAEKCLFHATKWDDNDQLFEEKYFWYEPNLELRAKIIAGWAQFHKDLESFEVQEVIQAAKAEPVRELPVISYRMNGMALTSNLVEFKQAAMTLVEESKLELTTDQDFANREALNKSFKSAEERLDLVKEQAVGEIKDVADFCRQVAEIGEFIRQARLNGEKQVEARKKALRLEIFSKARTAITAYIEEVNARLGKVNLPSIPYDIEAAMKGKKTIASLQSAANDEVARCKTEIDIAAAAIEKNLASLREMGKDFEYLFHDAQQLVLKPNEDLITLIGARITERKVQIEADRIAKEAADAAKAAEVAAKAAEVAAVVVPEPTPEPQIAQAAPAGSVPMAQADPAKLRAAVVDHQDVIASFFKVRNFGEKKEGEYRAVIVEFVKHVAAANLKIAA